MILDIFNFKKYFTKIKKYFQNKINYYNSYTVLFLSDRVDVEQKKYKVNVFKILIAVLSYTFLVFLITSLFYYFTPIKYLLFFNEDFFEYQNEQLLQLNKKVIFLTKELEELASTNKKLKYLEILADSLSADSLAAKKHEIIKKKKNIFGGDLFILVENILNYKQNIFVKPAIGFITRNYDKNLGHIGIDISLKNGTPIVASEAGVIIFAGYTVDDGNTVMILHSDNYISVYKHLSVIYKIKGARVKRGETLGLIGETGTTAEGPHLHFEILKDGNPIDPLSVLVK